MRMRGCVTGVSRVPEESFAGKLMSVFIPSNANVTRYPLSMNRFSYIAEEGKCREKCEALS